MSGARGFCAGMEPFLRRAWAFERRITCALSGAETRVAGAATWAPLGAHALAQTEEGVLTFPDARAPLHVRAAYTWHWGAGEVAAGAGAAGAGAAGGAAGAAQVRFPDGRAFVEVDDFVAARGAARVAHACAPDAYSGLFQFISDDRFSVEWTVSGPHKRYVSLTHYSAA